MKKDHVFTILMIFVVLSVLSMSIGYAAFNTELSITGEAYVRVDESIRINSIKVKSMTNGVYETYNSSYSKDTTSMFVTLPSKGSITYEVTIRNNTGKKYIVEDIIEGANSNKNVTYKINDLAKDDVIDNDLRTFTIVISNNTNVTQEESLVLQYLFEEFISISTITFDANGGNITTTSKEVRYGETYGDLPYPKRPHRRFVGWYTDTTYTTQVTSTSKVEKTEDQTLYAKWQLYNIFDGTDLTNFYALERKIGIESSAWERIGDSVGLEANAQIGTTTVKNDFDNIYPWSDIKSYNYDTGTKKITAWYGESGFTFTPTGNIEVLTYIPEFYYARYQIEDYEYIAISNRAQKGFTKSEAFSIGRYMMSGNSTRVHSRSGNTPLVSTTITNFRTYAQNLGSGFGQLDYHYFILQLLYLVEYADYNSQAKLGLGNTYSTAPITSGGCNSLGMHSGSITNDGKHSVIYRGIEDIFGNAWQFVDGINLQKHQAYINYNPATYQVDMFTGDYKKIGYLNYSGKEYYISKLGLDPANQLIALPIEAKNATVTTYITDLYWVNTGNNRIARIGGQYNSTLNAGLWYWHLDTSSSLADVASTARLVKTG